MGLAKQRIGDSRNIGGISPDQQRTECVVDRGRHRLRHSVAERLTVTCQAIIGLYLDDDLTE